MEHIVFLMLSFLRSMDLSYLDQCNAYFLAEYLNFKFDFFPAALNGKEELFEQFRSPERQQDIPTRCDYTRPDAMLASSDWFGLQSGHFKGQAPMTDCMAALLGDDLTSDYKQTAEAYLSPDHQGQRIGFYAWNNMPAVCQVSELP